MKIDLKKVIVKHPVMLWEHTGCEFTLWELLLKCARSSIGRTLALLKQKLWVRVPPGVLEQDVVSTIAVERIHNRTTVRNHTIA